jgi:hypothetical protein
VVDRKGNPRGGRGFLRAVSHDNRDRTDDPVQEVVGIALGFRMVFSEQAEIWTVRGILRDGSPTKEDVGELSFVLIPGDMEPATAVTGFIAVQPPYALALNEDQLWQQLRGFVVQLGYDQDGFYASIGVGGRHRYYEEYHQGR